MNLCRPPARAISASPGRKWRWYVLPRMISAPASSTSRKVIPLTAPRVPTGMIAGEVIEQARVETSRPMREGREVHFVARPSDETILSIDRSRNRDAEVPAAVVTGLSLDVIFPMLHGPYGEDGTIQGLLELANIPYVGAGVLASAVGMDKAVMKVLFAARGLRVCPYRVLLRHPWEAGPDKIAADLEKALN